MLRGIKSLLSMDQWVSQDENDEQEPRTEFSELRHDSDDADAVSVSVVPVYGKRTVLPSPMIARSEMSIWSILKQSIGKELSKVTMPVAFNEPLSFLQRLTEYLEYYTLLKVAAQETDPLKRIELVAAFAVSSLASNWERVGKPFNPLLGETYELDRLEDLGFRWISEQVSHHPPISAFHAEGVDFRFHGSVYPKLRFWGRSVEIQPKGIIALELTKMKDVYTWNNVSCSVHNLVVGTPFIEQHGTMEIVSQQSKLTCTLHFKASSTWLKNEASDHHIEGFIVDDRGHRLKALYGVWTSFLASVDVRTFERHFANWGKERKSRLSLSTDTSAIRRVPSAPPLTWKTKGATCMEEEANDVAFNDHIGNSQDQSTTNVAVPSTIPVLAESVVLWRVKPRPKGHEQYYHFTTFAMMLNEQLNGHDLPPTDSRLRPDIRCLEHGDLDGAASAKNRLEEKQREAHAKRKKEKFEWRPTWFRYEKHPHACEESWVFTNEYWSRRWAMCPDIF